MRPELPAVGVTAAAARLGADDGAVLVDVREPDEFRALRVEGAVLIPMSQFVQRFRELPDDAPLLVMCHVGGRSAMATDFLLRQGYADVWNVTGGIAAWQAAGLPTRNGPLEPGEGSPEVRTTGVAAPTDPTASGS